MSDSSGVLGKDGAPRVLAEVIDPDLVPQERLVAWMNAKGMGGGPLVDAELLAGGTQNVLLRFRRGDRTFVLRRPPRHKRASSDETMRREAVLLAGLAGTDVPHPGLIAACPDTDVIGAAFYLMQPIEGVNPCAEPATPHGDRAAAHAMALNMADSLAALGRVDPQESGIAAIGKAEGWLERQVPRWRRQLDSYAEFEGWTPRALPPVADLEAWLAERRPSAWHPGVIHGDYHAGNVMISRDGPEIVAVVDWELATVGDPLLDLGHLLATWPDPERGATPATMLDVPGLASRSELVERYAMGSTRELDAIDWYRALACYRLGVLLEGSHARALAGFAASEVGDRLHAKAVALFEQALELAG